MYEATITKVFCAAHAIQLPDGTLEPLHGHNWEICVTVATQTLNEIEVVMDFHELEQLVDQIVARANNRNLNDLEPFAGGKVNPTAERVAWWIGTEIAPRLRGGITLESVQVSEAPGCRATFKPS